MGTSTHTYVGFCEDTTLLFTYDTDLPGTCWMEDSAATGISSEENEKIT